MVSERGSVLMVPSDLSDQGRASLPELAANAAVELDNCYRKDATPECYRGATQLLADWFKAAFGANPDLSDIVLLWRVFGGREAYPQGMTVDELVAKAQALQSCLLNFEQADDPSLAELRDFCVKLSRQASATMSPWRRYGLVA